MEARRGALFTEMGISTLRPAPAPKGAAVGGDREGRVVTVAGMCPFSLVVVGTSTVMFALVWVE